MPPRKGSKSRPTPASKRATPGPTGTGTGSAQDTPAGGIASASPMMNATQVQTLLAEGIATALATFLAARNENSGVSGAGGSNSTDIRHNPRACSYKDFMACKPPTFRGTEGAVILSQWIEKMETVFQLCSCPADGQIKYAACTLMGSALSWWNDHTKTMGIEAAHALGWETFKDLIREEYCPRLPALLHRRRRPPLLLPPTCAIPCDRSPYDHSLMHGLS